MHFLSSISLEYFISIVQCCKFSSTHLTFCVILEYSKVLARLNIWQNLTNQAIFVGIYHLSQIRYEFRSVSFIIKSYMSKEIFVQRESAMNQKTSQCIYDFVSQECRIFYQLCQVVRHKIIEAAPNQLAVGSFINLAMSSNFLV